MSRSCSGFQCEVVTERATHVNKVTIIKPDNFMCGFGDSDDQIYIH